MIDAAPDHSRKPFHSNRVPEVCWCGKEFTLSPSEHRKYEKLGYGASCCNSHGKEASRRRKKGEIVKELKEWVQNESS